MTKLLCVSLSYYPGQKIDCCGIFYNFDLQELIRIRPINLTKIRLEVGDVFSCALINRTSDIRFGCFTINYKTVKKHSDEFVEYFDIFSYVPKRYLIDSIGNIVPSTSKCVLPLSAYNIFKRSGKSAKIELFDMQEQSTSLIFSSIDLCGFQEYSEAFALIVNTENLQHNICVGLLHM